jgi:hypothetical protein
MIAVVVDLLLMKELQQLRDEVGGEVDKVISQAKECAQQPIEDANAIGSKTVPFSLSLQDWPPIHDLDRMAYVYYSFIFHTFLYME